jgi:membrane dipeptidase
MDTSRRAFITSLALAGAAAAFEPRARAFGRSRWSAAALDGLEELYDRALVFDALTLVSDRELDPSGWQVVRRSGFTAIQTSLADHSLRAALADLAAWQARFERHPDRLAPVLKASDIERAKRKGKLGVMLGFQNATCIEDDLGNLRVLRDRGARCLQLTYNSRNLLGDGCTERTNAGLSDFGVGAVETMNELGMVVDLSHCGERTSRDAIAVSRRPPAFTHTMCRAIHDHPRAKSDELLRAMADRGGMIGIVSLGYFIGPTAATSFADYLNHIDHAVRVAGLEHVGLASDYSIRGIQATESRESWYEPRQRSFKPSYNLRWPPWIPELDPPERFRATARGLARRGYREGDIEKILGLNWVAYFKEVFGA